MLNFNSNYNEFLISPLSEKLYNEYILYDLKLIYSNEWIIDFAIKFIIVTFRKVNRQKSTMNCLFSNIIVYYLYLYTTLVLLSSNYV